MALQARPVFIHRHHQTGLFTQSLTPNLFSRFVVFIIIIISSFCLQFKFIHSFTHSFSQRNLKMISAIWWINVSIINRAYYNNNNNNNKLWNCKMKPIVYHTSYFFSHFTWFGYDVFLNHGWIDQTLIVCIYEPVNLINIKPSPCGKAAQFDGWNEWIMIHEPMFL